MGEQGLWPLTHRKGREANGFQTAGCPGKSQLARSVRKRETDRALMLSTLSRRCRGRDGIGSHTLLCLDPKVAHRRLGILIPNPGGYYVLVDEHLN